MKILFIAFRGTHVLWKEMKDVFNDMKFWKRPAWEGGGKVHTGFSSYVDEIWDDTPKTLFEHGVNKKHGKQKEFLQQDIQVPRRQLLRRPFRYVC